MPERLSFGLDRTKISWRLRVQVPQPMIRRAAADNPDFSKNLTTLAARGFLKVDDFLGDHPVNIGVNAKPIGRQGSIAKTITLAKVNDVLGTLITDVPTEEADPSLSLRAFWPGGYGDEFHFGATIALPDIAARVLGQVATHQMRVIAHSLRSLPRRFTQEDYTAMITANVDDATGISLSQSTHSSVHTMGENYVPGSRVVELEGNNVDPVAEPLVYLAGVVALAHAWELVKA